MASKKKTDSDGKQANTPQSIAKQIDEQRKATAALVGSELWLPEVVEHDYPAAGNYLGLIADPKTVSDMVADLKKAPIEMHRANDILRAAGLDLLPLGDPSVKRDLAKVMTGRRWSPVLVVRGDVLRGYPLTVADGYHRICASFHLSEDTYIPCKIADLPVREKVGK